jgi:hypothetical protein
LDTNYWVFKVKDEVGGIYGRRGFAIFDHRSSEGFWALKTQDEKGRLDPNVGLLKKGDSVIFYLVGQGGSRFVGTCVLDSGFVKLDAEKAEQIVHREYLDWDEGVYIKEVKKWARPLPIESLRGKDSFVSVGGKFGAYFKGSIRKIKNKQEYETIIREHELMV